MFCFKEKNGNGPACYPVLGTGTPHSIIITRGVDPTGVGDGLSEGLDEGLGNFGG